VPSAADPLELLAQLLGITRRELVIAIIRESHKAWRRELAKQLRRQPELPDEETDLWDPDTPEPSF